MQKEESIELLRKTIGEGEDVMKVLNLSEALLKMVSEGVMTMEDVLKALGEIRDSLGDKAVSTEESEKDLPSNKVDSPDDEDSTMQDKECIVRRLTPVEYARCQGFPDHYTEIDGPETACAVQYKGYGNSWATNCANFISTRVEMELRRIGHKGTINFATVCSGIEAQSESVKKQDWKCKFFSEIENFPCRVLEYHYPEVPNLGDMTHIHYDSAKGVISNSYAPDEGYELPVGCREAPIQEIPFKEGDLQVFSGGTPCTDISVAGKRAGMAEGSETHSALAWHFQRIIAETSPTFTIWENVYGVFSSNGGADFIWFVNRCAESGYSLAWRVLDAQYVMTEEFPRAVPQRRRRIWLVGYKGNDWRIPARIVFERKDDLTDMPPERVLSIGYKTLNDGAVKRGIRETTAASDGNECEDLFGLMMSDNDEGKHKLRKVSQMTQLAKMPMEADFEKVSISDIYDFASSVGEPGYMGPVLRTGTKRAYECLTKEEKEAIANGDMVPRYEELKKAETEGELKWEGAESIIPAILENIGNAGILANGRICTMKCREWTSGIQLSPETFEKWEEAVSAKEWARANDLLPDAYDGTICGLRDIVELDVGDKFDLSWRGCYGILRRAEMKGKELPPVLAMALIESLRRDAGIVKWYALNGKETAKDGGSFSERECAKMCFDNYIASEIRFEDVVAVAPKDNREEELSDEETDEAEDEGYEEDGD